MHRIYGIALLLIVLAACSASSSSAPSPTGPADSSDTPSASDVEISMELTVKPGEELHQCQFVTIPSDTDINVVKISHEYTKGSHHFLVYMTDLDSIPADMQGQADCVRGDEPYMLHTRGLLYGAQSPAGSFPLPEGVGFQLKAHQVLMLQAHYINPSSQPIAAKVKARFGTAPADKIQQQAGFLLFYDPFIFVPPKGSASSGIRCPVPNDVNLIAGFTHYHQRGRQMQVWLDPGMSSQSAAPFFATRDWEHPEDFHGPMAIKAGSVVRIQCDFTNLDGVDVFQGPNAATSEMCVFAGLYYPRSPDPSAFEFCSNLSVTGTGANTCSQLLTCIQSCPAGEAPKRLQGGVSVGSCWEKCLTGGCEGATDLLLPATACVGRNCQAECAAGQCSLCALDKCGAEVTACLGHACAH